MENEIPENIDQSHVKLKTKEVFKNTEKICWKKMVQVTLHTDHFKNLKVYALNKENKPLNSQILKTFLENDTYLSFELSFLHLFTYLLSIIV